MSATSSPKRPGRPLAERVLVSPAQSIPTTRQLLIRIPFPDEVGHESRKFLIPVETTLKELLAREDTDNNMQITIDDAGPKVR